MFGKDYDKKRMEDAIRVCQLERDLTLFGHGLLTVIGERGVNISGGQKARLSLARAVYSNSDIVLLDDPLSAVDPEVASKIFNECIKGYLKNKLVILVTHQIQFIEHCPKIMHILDGKVACLGSHQELTASGFNVKEIMESFNKALEDKQAQNSKKNEAETQKRMQEKIVKMMGEEIDKENERRKSMRKSRGLGSQAAISEKADPEEVELTQVAPINGKDDLNVKK